MKAEWMRHYYIISKLLKSLSFSRNYKLYWFKASKNDKKTRKIIFFNTLNIFSAKSFITIWKLYSKRVEFKKYHSDLTKTDVAMTLGRFNMKSRKLAYFFNLWAKTGMFLSIKSKVPDFFLFLKPFRIHWNTNLRYVRFFYIST